MGNWAIQKGSRFLVLGLVLGGPGCGLLLGLDEFKDAPPSPGTSGSGGQGGNALCEAGDVVSCYDGPSETRGVGLCKDGKKTCNDDGTAYGECQAQVTPAAETCANPADENCDGHDCALWAKNLGDISNQHVSNVAVDKDEHIYIAGSFNGTIAFDPTQPVSAEGSSNIYLAKLNKNGDAIWSKGFTGYELYPAGVATDPQGNVVLAGTFSGSLTFGSTTHQTTERVRYAAFATMFSPDGDVLWTEMYENEQDETRVTRPVTDSTGAVILFGHGYCGQNCGEPNERLWLRKYSSDGSIVWFKNFPYSGSIAERAAAAVTTDAMDNIIITGSFGGPYGEPTTNFGSGTLTTQGGSDAFIAKLTPAGGLVWQQSFGDAGDQGGRSVAADSNGNIVFMGTYDGSMRFGTTVIRSEGMTDIFIAKLKSNASSDWAKSFGGPEAEIEPQVVVDSSGSIALTAEIKESVDFGGGMLPAAGGIDLPLVKLAPDGAHVWSKTFGDSVDQHARALTTTQEREILLVGDVEGSIDVGTGQLFSAGGLDILVAQFAP
jgi:hypothetical protein